MSNMSNNIISNLEKHMFLFKVENQTPPQIQINHHEQSNNLYNNFEKQEIKTNKVNTPLLISKFIENNNVVECNNTKVTKKYVNPVKNMVNNNHRIDSFQKDELFWHYFNVVNGFKKYQLKLNININDEKTEKIEMVNLLREKKHLLKKNKISLTEVETDIVNSNKIGITTFIALSIISNLRIIIIYETKNIYWITPDEMINLTNPIKNICIIRNKSTYTAVDCINIDEINEKICKMYKFDNYLFKLKPISSYLLQELKDLYNLLNIPINDKKPLKKTLYDNLALYL